MCFIFLGIVLVVDVLFFIAVLIYTAVRKQIKRMIHVCSVNVNLAGLNMCSMYVACCRPLHLPQQAVVADYF